MQVRKYLCVHNLPVGRHSSVLHTRNELLAVEQHDGAAVAGQIPANDGCIASCAFQSLVSLLLLRGAK
jgi:hypothetical protein